MPGVDRKRRLTMEAQEKKLGASGEREFGSRMYPSPFSPVTTRQAGPIFADRSAKPLFVFSHFLQRW